MPRNHTAINSSVRIACTGLGVVFPTDDPTCSTIAEDPLTKIMQSSQIAQYSERQALPEKRKYRFQEELGFVLDRTGSVLVSIELLSWLNAWHHRWPWGAGPEEVLCRHRLSGHKTKVNQAAKRVDFWWSRRASSGLL